MAELDERLVSYLQGLEESGSLRTLKPGRPDGTRLIERGGRRLINFSSNDYLGLAWHPALIARAAQWTGEWGAGAGASRLVTGTYEIHIRVEEKLAALKKTEAALIFGSGYQANAAVLPAMLDRDMLGAEALVFTDKLIHASLHHGIAAAGLRQIRFRHNDPGHLEELLNKHRGDKGQPFIITESVFSMDGDRADLQALSELAGRHGAFLYVDEAHATGVLGDNGMGLSGDVKGGVDLVMGTFSKALGSFGAYVACSKTIKEYLVNRCAGLIYSTAPPPGVLGAMDAALDLAPGMDTERERLHANAEKLRNALAGAGLDTAGSTTQIVPAVIGSGAAAMEASRMLEDQGVLGIAIRPPTVAKGQSRIRFSLSAAHTDEDMDRLCALIPAVGGYAGK